MKSRNGLKIIPGAACNNRYKYLIEEAKEFIQGAYVMMGDVVQGMQDQGLLTRREAKEQKKGFRVARNEFLKRAPRTENDIIEYYEHARGELRAAVEACQRQFPELAGTVTPASMLPASSINESENVGS